MTAFIGIHGAEQIENIALPRLADALDQLDLDIKVHADRIAAIESAFHFPSKPVDNTAAIEALKQADNAIQKAIAHFARTAKENHR